MGSPVEFRGQTQFAYLQSLHFLLGVLSVRLIPHSSVVLVGICGLPHQFIRGQGGLTCEGICGNGGLTLEGICGNGRLTLEGIS